MFVLLCYDVPADRTNKYKKLFRRFLHHHQNSVFMGDLPESKHIKLRQEIARLHQEGDEVLELVAENRHNVKLCQLNKNKQGVLIEAPDRRHTENAYVL